MASIRLPEDDDFVGINVGKIDFKGSYFSFSTGDIYDTFYAAFQDGTSVCQIERKDKNPFIIKKSRVKASPYHGILPVIEFTDFVKSNAKLVDEKLGIYEFGRYMKNGVTQPYKNEELENAFKDKKMKETGRTYTINGESIEKNSQYASFTPLTVKEYEYDGTYCKGSFVRMQNLYKKFEWFAVEPIKWCLNKKNNCLISTEILLSNIPYFLEDSEKKDYESSFIKEFLEKYLYRDLFQGLKYVNDEKKNNERANEVQKLVDEIKKYSEYCFDKESVFAKVNEFIANYKRELNELKNDKSGLVLKDQNTIYLELINNLSRLLENLKTYREKNLIYFDIIGILNNCLSILQDDVVVVSENELEKDMKVIKNTIIPFLGENTLLDELINIFLNEKNRIMDYLNKRVNINGLTLESESELYTSVYDFEISMRKRLMPFLTMMSNKVNQKDLADEVNKSINESMLNIPGETKNRIAKVYLNAINSEVIKINRFSGSELYQSELKAILDFKINYEDIVEKTIGILQNALISLYKLEDRIQKDNLRNVALSEYDDVANIKL